MIIQESGENYLETILMLQKQKGSVRSIDVAGALNFSKASISRAMSILRRENYIIMEPDGNIVLTEDLFLNTLYGTLLASVGMAIVFNYNGSTGGTDIVAKIINHYFHLDVGKSLLMIDFIITAGGFLVFGWDVGLFSLLSVLINGNLIDRFIEGTKTAKEIMIISKKSQAIRRYIVHDLDRSCTVLHGYGGYTGDDTEVLYVVLSRRDYIKLRNFIIEVDNRAFLSVNEVREVLGEGYQDLVTF